MFPIFFASFSRYPVVRLDGHLYLSDILACSRLGRVDDAVRHARHYLASHVKSPGNTCVRPADTRGFRLLDGFRLGISRMPSMASSEYTSFSKGSMFPARFTEVILTSTRSPSIPVTSPNTGVPLRMRCPSSVGSSPPAASSASLRP